LENHKKIILARGIKIGILGDNFSTIMYRTDEKIEWLKGEVVEYIKENNTGIVYCSKLDADVAPRYHHLFTREEYLEEIIINWNKLR
jgi:2-hydroxy-3-keto-5-methylthiopentenyl-1-phosphate phosphatase